MIEVDANFPGGAVTQVRFDEGNRIRFAAPLDGSPQSLWFYFRVRGVQGKQLTLCQDQMEQVLGVFESETYKRVQPVIREGEEGEWTRVPKHQTKFSIDPLEFRFTITPSRDTVYIAFSYPYTTEHFQHFITSNPSPYLQQTVLGRTKEGRPFPAVTIGEEDESNRIRKKLIVCQARQHAGEVSGSYVLEGIIKEALADTEQGRQLRKHMVLVVFPFVDLDGVQQGRYGKNRPPIDMGRDWSLEPNHPEIRMMQQEVERLARQYDFTLFMDLHAPQPGGNCYLIPDRRFAMGQQQWGKFWSFYEAFGDAVSRVCTCGFDDFDADSINWSGIYYHQTSKHYYSSKYKATTMTLETSYHVDRQGTLLTPDHWRSIGQIWLRVAQAYYSQPADIGWSELKRSHPSRDLLLEYWDMVKEPKHAKLIAIHKETFSFVSERDDGEMWMTCSTPFHASVAAPGIQIDTDEGAPFQTEVILYRFNDEVALGEIISYYLHAANGSIVWQLPEEFHASVRDHAYKVSLRISGLRGTAHVQVIATK